MVSNYKSQGYVNNCKFSHYWMFVVKQRKFEYQGHTYTVKNKINLMKNIL